jgi:signal peptidase II
VKRVPLPSSLRWYALAAAVLVLDYVTKTVVLHTFTPGESLALAPFFNLVLVFNTGAAFSFLAASSGWQTFFFASVAVVASVVISVLIYRNPGKRMFSGGLALILGGALGNLHDRLVYGKVVDFLDFHLAGWHWPAFNVADSAIFVGAATLILESFLHSEPKAGEEKA